MIHLPDVEKIYEGSTPVEKIMQGAEQVWRYYLDGGLMPEYVDCGCIYGSGNTDAFISLPFKTSGTLKYRFSGQFLSNTGGVHLGASGSIPDNADYRLFMQQGGGWTYLDMGSKRFYVGNMSAGNMGKTGYAQWSAKTDADITVWNHAIYDNKQGYVVKSGATVTDVPSIYTFNANIGRLKIYALQAWETSGGTDVLIFDGVPKVRYADNQPGLYDNVGGGFYTNTSTTINACYYTLQLKPNWRNVSGLTQYTGDTITLFSGNDGILFTDYSGNVMDAINATVGGATELGTGVRWNRVEYDADGWARFKFDKPLYGITCGLDTSGGYKMPFTVIPSSVRVLGGIYGLGVSTPVTYEADRRMRYFIPEGVETITGQCVYGTTLFENGSVSIPSTVTTIGVAENNYNSFYPINGCFPKLYYYNGTYDEYNAIDWQGRVGNTTGQYIKFAGYPVKCTDGVFYFPKTT